MTESPDVVRARPTAPGGGSRALALLTAVPALLVGAVAAFVAIMSTLSGQWSDVVQGGVIAVGLLVGAVFLLRHRWWGPWLVAAGAAVLAVGSAVYLIGEATDPPPYNLSAVDGGVLTVVVVILVVLPVAIAGLALSPPVRRWAAAR